MGDNAIQRQQIRKIRARGLCRRCQAGPSLHEDGIAINFLTSIALIIVILVRDMLLQNMPLAGDQSGIPPETVAKYLHAVIEVDRTFYTIYVVERMQKYGGAQVVGNWRAKKNTLQLPAQFFMKSGTLATMIGTQVRYRLIVSGRSIPSICRGTQRRSPAWNSSSPIRNR